MGSHIGVSGLAVMGANLARNIARRGVPTAVHNPRPSRRGDSGAGWGAGGSSGGPPSPGGCVGAPARPRRVIVMVKAGPPVDGVIEDLAPLLDDGDIVIDAGNSHFAD